MNKYGPSTKPGDKYGKWTVQTKTWKNNKPYWICKCECGAEKAVGQAELRNGKSKSCGNCKPVEVIVARCRVPVAPKKPEKKVITEIKRIWMEEPMSQSQIAEKFGLSENQVRRIIYNID